jgi:HK97 family phage major capsid protein
MDARDLRRKYANLVNEMRGYLERLEKEGREFSGEAKETFDRMEQEARSLREQIEAIERVESASRAVLDEARVLNEPEAPEVRVNATKEYRDAFYRFLRAGRDMVECRDLYKGSDPAGGYLVPESLESKIREMAAELNVIRQFAEVVVSSTKEKIPVEASIPQFGIIAEKGTYTEANLTFDVVQLDAYKIGGIIKVSEELLADAATDLEAYIARKAGQGLGVAEENYFINGDGTGEPTGFLARADVGVTAAATDALSFDEVKSLPWKLKQAYKSRAIWLMHTDIALAVSLLKNDVGQYLWPLEQQISNPPRLLGYPVYTSAFMPAELEAGAKVIAFGDFSNYRIQDRLGITIQKLVELYAETGQVGFRVRERVDGNLLITEAVQVLQMAAGGSGGG